MKYLKQPRGVGTGFVFRMATPAQLIGTISPWTGRPFGKEIMVGLDTRQPIEAKHRRDIKLGQLRELVLGLASESKFSLNSAKAVRRDIEQLVTSNCDPSDAEGIELMLTSELDAAEKRGVPLVDLERFAKVALNDGCLLSDAADRYLAARAEGNRYGYAPLSPSTVAGFRTALGYLRNFLQDADGTSVMQDVTAERAKAFKQTFLHELRTQRAPSGLASKSIEKQITMLSPFWVWAAEQGLIPPQHSATWVFGKGIRRTTIKDQPTRETYSPEEFSLLVARLQWGHRGGDLIRLALATGCRCNELATLLVKDIADDASHFIVQKGKTINATRTVPVVGKAQAVLAQRLLEQKDNERLFPEWPVRASSGKAAAAPQWFTSYRRKQLGAGTDKRLSFHSLRHTWRTAARRAGLSEADTNDLGGWTGPRTSSSVYDHGLLPPQLVKAQEAVWKQLQSEGYLKEY